MTTNKFANIKVKQANARASDFKIIDSGDLLITLPEIKKQQLAR